jgi:hypothetical protein
MIFRLPHPEEPVDQGDIFDDCPLLSVLQLDTDSALPSQIGHFLARVFVLTQTCDLAQEKLSQVVTAVVLDGQQLIDRKVLKAADVKGPIRAGRVFGWYFLPRHPELGLGESVVHLWDLHTVRLDLLQTLCRQGKRRAKLQPLYREHLAKHFADTYSRIGLPQPYATD